MEVWVVMEADFAEFQGVRGVFSSKELAEEYISSIRDAYLREGCWPEPYQMDIQTPT